MSNEKFLKITYHGGSGKGSKLNAYLKMPSPTYAVLMREIAIRLFEQRQQPKTDVRAYWIDEDGDEIEIVNQCDYEIFMSKRSERRHLQVSPIASTEKSATSSSTDTDPSAFVIHERVECDSCGNAPVIGFRYKCIQCPNFDLCERCEAQHKHSEHMMVRMPNDNCPSVIEAWISGRANRRHQKRNGSAGACPFVAKTAGPSAEGAEKTAEAKDHHHGHGRHGRKHEKHRRHMQNGIFTHLYNMMHDLAEGGPAVDSEVEAANTAVHAAAHNAATKAASASAAAAAASAAAATAASQALFGMATAPPAAQNESAPQEKGAIPKTPPSTPSNNVTTEEPEFKKSKESNANESAKVSNESEPTTPVLPFVNPNFIKILNNFSEMFGKMLDPMDGSSDGSSPCPFAATAFPSQRKSSTSSTTSSNASTANTTIDKQSEKPQEDKPMEVNAASATSSIDSTANATIDKQSEKKQEDKPMEVSAATAGTSLGATAGTTSTVTETVVETVSSSDSKENTPEHRRRSQSEENDWQLIDKQATPTESLVSISASTSTDSIDGAAAAAATNSGSVTITSVTTIPAASATSTQTQTTQINYEQLSKDLRAHILQEQATAQTTSVPAPAAAAPAPAAVQPEVREESQRAVPVFHSDQRINDAVQAMMAMGFSNEGAWLTQLLESVNGSIPQALDLMSAAQRST